MASRARVELAALAALVALAALCTFTASCSAPASPRTVVADDRAAWIFADAAALPVAERRAVAQPPVREETVSIAGAPASVARRPPRRARIDLQLHQAKLSDALELLAEAGRYNVVVQEGVTGEVSASFTGVDPYDALVALAEAHGAEVVRQGDVLIVKKR